METFYYFKQENFPMIETFPLVFFPSLSFHWKLAFSNGLLFLHSLSNYSVPLLWQFLWQIDGIRLFFLSSYGYFQTMVSLNDLFTFKIYAIFFSILWLTEDVHFIHLYIQGISQSFSMSTVSCLCISSILCFLLLSWPLHWFHSSYIIESMPADLIIIQFGISEMLAVVAIIFLSGFYPNPLFLPTSFSPSS